MLSWDEFATVAPEMARFGEARLNEKVMYLGTVRKDHYPRVHPFTPFIGSGRLFAFMEPTSPKGHDLKRDAKYSMHSLVKDQKGSDGEFAVTGTARAVTDAKTREIAVRGCPYTPQDRYVCFEFLIEECFTCRYVDGKPHYSHWKAHP